MLEASFLRNIGNRLYQHAFPIYRPLYAAYKAYADRSERRVLKEILFPGAVAIDAGANIGIYSQFFSRCVGPAGTVYSFEPAPENFIRLCSATRKLTNVHVLQAAVGERSGHTKLYLSDKLNVDHRAYLTEPSWRCTIQIEMVALDEYFKLGQRIDLIKMDIQGYELHALRGATRLLADNPAAKLVMELWPHGLRQAGENWVDLIDALTSNDMVVSQITAKGLEPLRFDSITEDSDCYVNLFATRRWQSP